ncbi:hypothetical protein ACH4VX_18350 [Streptomyces sp. NPDC020731]|uniref:hypothetical protein n=1 Tax=Streptomyces sp. NPDC020731 TaxID=3365085 RepID=UPI00378B29F5
MVHAFGICERFTRSSQRATAGCLRATVGVVRRHTGARELATAANLDVTRKERDRVGVDRQSGYAGRSGARRCPVIEAQGRCTSSPDVREDRIRCPLKVKNFDPLAGPDYEMPRFLAPAAQR